MTKLIGVVAAPKLPQGRHVVVLDRIEQAEHRTFGPGYRWFYRADSGEETAMWTGEVIAPGNAAHRMFEQLSGGKLLTGAPVDSDNYVGKRFEVVVAADGQISKISPAK